MNEKKKRVARCGVGVAVFFVGAALFSGCNEKTIYEMLDEKCNSGDTVEINGVDIAVINLLLTNQQEVLATNRGNIKSEGNGDLSVLPKNKIGLTILHDGRLVMVDDSKSESKITISGNNENGKTRITASMNCKDRSKLPTRGGNNGFSPDNRSSKPTPTSYPGFGH